MIGRKRILIAPLDWGLGHATRCIPIIKELLSHGHEVILAAEGPTKILLNKEFPGIECFYLNGYHIKYAQSKKGLLLKLIVQLPKLFLSIWRESQWLKKVIKKNRIDIVIADNRFGLSNKRIYSIFITHQLLIKTPLLERWLQKLNYYFINQFDECWVPDTEKNFSLAGQLSHPEIMPSIPVYYIGWLSRFEKLEQSEKHLLILLSGPEPQRTLLEKKVVAQLKNFSSPVLLIRGLPGDHLALKLPSPIICINHLPAKELQYAIATASFVIARSGYSTIMDLMTLKKKSILIPTPGQTEQEYLSQYLMEQKFAYIVSQEHFELEEALAAAEAFYYSFPEQHEGEAFKKILSLEHLPAPMVPL